MVQLPLRVVRALLCLPAVRRGAAGLLEQRRGATITSTCVTDDQHKRLVNAQILRLLTAQGNWASVGWPDLLDQVVWGSVGMEAKPTRMLCPGGLGGGSARVEQRHCQ
jgi:hypothetical protein